ncbi:MAG: hypothetical protein L0Z62_49685 [Gemmataceae bacterium]|nr:hypothetical protein [Gemmataceae bacterium]
MSQRRARSVRAPTTEEPAGAPDTVDTLLPAAALEQALGQSLREALDVSHWDDGGGLESLVTRVNQAVQDSVVQEERVAGLVRGEVLARLQSFPDAPPQAGVYAVPERLLRDARRNVLLAGNLTAADGACTGHDGLAATLVCIGVSLVRYDGQLNSWRTTFLRRDYDARTEPPLQEIRNLLDRRAARSENEPGAERDRLSYLLRRGFMAAAERKALLEKAGTRWRMGHGIPAPLELLTGSGCMELIDEILPVLEGLLLQETRWVFVPDRLSSRALATLANALGPGELAVFQKGKPLLETMVERGTYDAARRQRVQAFAARAGEALVVGGFRATPHGPAQLFVAHTATALEAGILAMADAALQPHRAWPLLLELAGLTAAHGLNVEAFAGLVETAYARARGSHLFSADRLLSP